jgi:DNA-binding NtrC family response regulator
LQVADTDATVLVTGESGTGKDLIGKILHENSSRRNRPFIAVNAGAIPEALMESELFGHAKGAFTGAEAEQMGKFRAADGGTIFLDEVSEMNAAAQVKLLRVLQSGEYSRVGEAENRYCDVRVVAASNQDLRKLVDEGKFRPDLYYRLNVIHLHLPPLRERAGDVPLLTDYFLRLFAKTYHKPNINISTAVTDVLDQHDYPGNIRELENVLHRAVILCGEGQILPRHLPSELTASEATAGLSGGEGFHEAKTKAVEDFERGYLTLKLKKCGGIVSRAADQAGLSERVFHEKLKKYGIRAKTFRASHDHIDG